MGLLLGKLTAHFGVSRAFAFVVMNILTNGGTYYICVVYPFLAPFIGTLRFYIAVAGVSAAVGW